MKTRHSSDSSIAGDVSGTATRDHIITVIDRVFGYRPKDMQIDAIYALVYGQEDLILIARTGFGKSLVFQAVPLMYTPVKSALIIMPLNALEEEQCEKLKLLTGCKPFVLNGDSNTRANLALIRAGTFTHSKYMDGLPIKT